jgi:UDP-N-acetylglucosamine 3-dehydrogenase
MGQNHVRIYSEMEEVKLVGVADINKKLAEETAAKYNTKAFTDYNEMFLEGLDAVSVVVPTINHKEVVLNSLDKNLHVLVEKPITNLVEDAELMIETAKEKGKILMVGHIERFNPAIIKLKEIIDSGAIGDIISISTKRVGPYNPKIKDVGVILDNGIHDIDIISHLYRTKINRIYAVAGVHIDQRPNPKFEDHASIFLKSSNKSLGIVQVSWFPADYSSSSSKVRKLTAIGVNGFAHLDYINQTVEFQNNGSIIKAKVEKSDSLKNELKHFINCIAYRKMPYPSGEDGKYALEIALAAITSYQEDRLISI